jgi:hypothetical protein
MDWQIWPSVSNEPNGDVDVICSQFAPVDVFEALLKCDT